MVPQSVYEFWVVATRPLAQNGLGMTTQHTKAKLDELAGAIELLPESPTVLDEWLRLVVRYDCKGKPAYDARIVAAMLVHGMTQLLTLNARDFLRYPEITLLDPATITAA